MSLSSTTQLLHARHAHRPSLSLHRGFDVKTQPPGPPKSLSLSPMGDADAPQTLQPQISHDNTTVQTASQRAKKVKRISKACDFCHNRSIRCSGSVEDPSKCQSCVEYDQPCTYDRPTKKRGAKGGKIKVPSPPTPNNQTLSGPSESTSRSNSWQPQTIASPAVIMDLVEVYFEVIYPIYPFFHRPTMIFRVSSGEYNTNRPFYSAVMALCALSSARVRDGSLYSTRQDPRVLAQIPSSVFFAAAQESIPHEASASQELDWLRACALLSLAALQNNQIVKMHYFLGLYGMFVRCDGLHDEKNWIMPLTIIQREERRRLYWSMYCFEVYAAAVWGSVIGCREAQSNVHYPAEVDDEFLTRTNDEEVNRTRSATTSEITLAYTLNNWGGMSGPVSWLQGWNFATDLYRVLEHALDGYRKRSPETDHTKFVAEIWKMKLPQQASVLEAMMHKYAALPPRFKQTLPVSLNATEDRFSFQAANIAATMELVRMTLITSAHATAEDRCHVLNELVNTFANVPVQYLRAMSTPILHHLAGIGTILEQVFENPVSEATYGQVRAVIIALADLLASLESGMGSAAGASDRLRSQVHRMDGHMQSQRNHHAYRYPPGPTQYTSSASAVSAGSPPAGLNSIPQYLSGGGRVAGYEQQGSGPASAANHDANSQYSFPAELFDEWGWAFDFAQSQG